MEGIDIYLKTLHYRAPRRRFCDPWLWAIILLIGGRRSSYSRLSNRNVKWVWDKRWNNSLLRLWIKSIRTGWKQDTMVWFVYLNYRASVWREQQNWRCRLRQAPRRKLTQLILLTESCLSISLNLWHLLLNLPSLFVTILSLSTLAKRSRRSHSITPSRAQNPVKTAGVERDIREK